MELASAGITVLIAYFYTKFNYMMHAGVYLTPACVIIISLKHLHEYDISCECIFQICGPAATSAFPASLLSYFLKFFTKRLARSFAFSSHWEASA